MNTSKITKSKSDKNMNVNELEEWLWQAACKIRGPVDAPKFKDYILPLIFLKRLSDVFDDEIKKLTKKIGDEKTVKKLVKADTNLVRFYIPDDSKWDKVHNLTSNIGQNLTDIIRGVTKNNKQLQGVLDIVDYNATVSGQRIVDDDRLSSLIEVLSDPRYRLGLNDVEPDILGRSYEYLLRKFAEGQGQTAGEFFTPKEIAWLMARLLNPKEGDSVSDPACGSGGLLIKCQLTLQNKKKVVKKPLQLYGQEINHSTFAISRMNMIIHDMEGKITLGDSFKHPQFIEKDSLQKFDLVAANPMWNQSGYDTNFYDSDSFGRFSFGYPPVDSADWGWIQHMFASLKDEGKLILVIDTGATSRGSGNKNNDKEKEIRKKFIDDDLIEAVILLPENLFYNTIAPGQLIIINKNKSHKGEVLIINSSEIYTKGKPKNYLPDSAADLIIDTFNDWKNVDGFAKILSKKTIIKNDYNIGPSRYISLAVNEEYIPLKTCISELKKIEIKKKSVDLELNNVLSSYGLEGIFVNDKTD